MTSASACRYCNLDVPPHLDRCPHCGQPAGYPNVRAAETAAERDALDERYRAALQATAPTARPALHSFEAAVTERSQALLARPANELLRLAASDREHYASFYSLVEAGVRSPSGERWDRLREAVDSRLFNYYKEQIRFAALSLNGRGLDRYGDCHLTLKTEMIGHRATVFEENSILFMERCGVGLTEELPTGYRATWAERGRLAVAKLAGRVGEWTGSHDHAALLMHNGADAGSDDFIEVHIYGSLSIHCIAAAHLRRGSLGGARVKALREQLKSHGIAVTSD